MQNSRELLSESSAQLPLAGFPFVLCISENMSSPCSPCLDSSVYPCDVQPNRKQRHPLLQAVWELHLHHQSHRGNNNKGTHIQTPTVPGNPNGEVITRTFSPFTEEETNYPGDLGQATELPWVTVLHLEKVGEKHTKTGSLE